MKKFAIGILMGVLFAGNALAQTVNASLGGTVTDNSGAVIPGAVVTATGIETGVQSKTITNEAGAYQFPSLQVGQYRASALLSGFKEAVVEPVTLGVGAQVRLNFTLVVAGLAQSVEVTTGDSPLLATSSSVSSVIAGQQILDLPLIDQSATSLALTQAQFAGGIGTGVSVAGGTTMALLTTVNGISVTNTRLDRAGGLNSFQLTQSVDLVDEIKVVTSPADAESGRALGQVQMNVRSGSNQFHGSVVNGLRNTALNANTFWNNLQGLPRQDLKRNQFAGRIGGPIKKNKTFFFFLYAGNRQKTSAAATRTVLTEQARLGNFRFFPGAINANDNATNSNPTVDLNGNPIQPSTATGPLQSISVLGRDPNRPVADPTGLVQKYIKMTPLPNDFTVGDGLNTAGFRWQVPSYSNSDQFTGKVDHNFGVNHHVNVVFTKQHDPYTSTAQIYPDIEAFGVSQMHAWFMSLNVASTLKPTLLNEFRAGAQHPDLDQVGGTRAYPQVYPTSNGVFYTPGFSSFTSPIPGNIDSRLIDPVYTIGDTLSWTHGRHAFKMGFQTDAMSSNSFNINNNFVPSVTLGAGSTAVQNITNVPGLVTQNQGLATNLLTDLTGSVNTLTQGFGVADGKNPSWIPYPNRRAWHQRDASAFFKDDFKPFSNLTLNLGVRWDWTGAPWDRWGRTPLPVGGFGGLFGTSGTGFGALWAPGASGGTLTQMQTVGPHSAHPDLQLYNDYYKGFEPAIGFSWSIPYFGKDKTVLRAGYTWTRPVSQSFLAIDGSISQFGTSATVTSVAPTFLNSVSLPLSPTFTNPLQVWPINDKTQSISAYDPNFEPPIVQSFNVSLERQLTRSMTIAVRYVGNKTTHLVGGYNLNFTNVFENGFLEATNITAQGGNAALFDKILMGINVPGAGVVNGSTLTGSQALRAYTNTFGFLAGNNASGLANFFNTTLSLQPTATAVRGGLLTNAGLPANFVTVNPQYSGVNFRCACLNTNYNSGVIELQQRLRRGLAFQTNFTWAKSMQLNGTGRNIRNFNEDRSQVGQKFAYKASGTYELPVGPGRQFLNSQSGVKGAIGKVIGGWQTGGILTMSSGSYLSITCGGSPTGGDNTCDALTALPEDPGHIIKTSNGVLYYDPAVFAQVNDPFCNTLTTQQNLQSRCTFKAMTYNGQPLFANSAQGKLGNMNSVTSWTGPGVFDLDVNMLRRFTVKEGITAEFRMDAIAVTNTPHFNNPNLNINGTTFGRISAPSAGGANSFTTPAPFAGNRVFVANVRVSF